MLADAVDDYDDDRIQVSQSIHVWHLAFAPSQVRKTYNMESVDIASIYEWQGNNEDDADNDVEDKCFGKYFKENVKLW